ncbi:MAG: saccharopine dehydrogenase C-terminal domain-containing protein [Bacteroidota bacterium]
MAQPHILLLGAGKSAATLIGYLHTLVTSEQWLVTVADRDLSMVEEKIAPYPGLRARTVDLENPLERTQLISEAALVISLLPPSLQLTVAKDCLALGKHFLSASYTDPDLLPLAEEIKAKNLLFLMEMGLDPGIDHMSAMEMIHRIREGGGTIHSFASHCGGLVAPASDDNPWHYKFSWNPRNVILAGKAGAVFKQNSEITRLSYEQLFAFEQPVHIAGIGELATYPNRDSLAYIPIYGLEDAATFIRTTLRYPIFCRGWQLLIQLGCTREDNHISTEGLTHRDFFQLQLEQAGWRLQDIPSALMPLMISIGWNDETPLQCPSGSSAAILQCILEKRWALLPGDRDMIVMLHELTYQQGTKKMRLQAQLVVEGDDRLHTAMAKTVGLPLGIAAALIMKGVIKSRGLQIPIQPDIYQPVLTALHAKGIRFQEQLQELR